MSLYDTLHNGLLDLSQSHVGMSNVNDKLIMVIFVTATVL